MGSSLREASAALLLLAGCATAGGETARVDADALRAELRTLRRENEALSARVDDLSGRVDVLTARVTRAQPEPKSPPGAPAPQAAAAPVVPPDLQVVRVEPPSGPAARRAPRAAPPPVPTAVAIAEPDLSRLGPSAPKARGLSAAADAELSAARARSGLDRAHALEDFTKRYPRHPSADNALLEASAAYQEAGRSDAACTLARRTADEYPAGDAVTDALERLAACADARGDTADAQRIRKRLTTDYPDSPAAARAGGGVTPRSTNSGSAGETSPREVPARSGP